MHRSVSKLPDELLYTESCVCEGKNCNAVRFQINYYKRKGGFSGVR